MTKKGEALSTASGGNFDRAEVSRNKRSPRRGVAPIEAAEKAIIYEALNQICAYVGAIASLFGEAEPKSRDRPEVRELEIPGAVPSQEPSPTEEPIDATTGLICAADVPDPETADDTPDPTVSTPENPEPTKPASANIPLSPSYEQVRKLLAEKARTGYRAEVKALLTKHGVKQLSDITDPGEYYEIMVEAGGIGDG